MIKKEEYISFVKEKMFSDEYINEILNEYKEFIEEKKELIKLELENFSLYSTSEFMQKMYDSTNNILSATYENLHLITKEEFHAGLTGGYFGHGAQWEHHPAVQLPRSHRCESAVDDAEQ